LGHREGVEEAEKEIHGAPVPRAKHLVVERCPDKRNARYARKVHQNAHGASEPISSLRCELVPSLNIASSSVKDVKLAGVGGGFEINEGGTHKNPVGVQLNREPELVA